MKRKTGMINCITAIDDRGRDLRKNNKKGNNELLIRFFNLPTYWDRDREFPSHVLSTDTNN